LSSSNFSQTTSQTKIPVIVKTLVLNLTTLSRDGGLDKYYYNKDNTLDKTKLAITKILNDRSLFAKEAVNLPELSSLKQLSIEDIIEQFCNQLLSANSFDVLLDYLITHLHVFVLLTNCDTVEVSSIFSSKIASNQQTRPFGQRAYLKISDNFYSYNKTFSFSETSLYISALFVDKVSVDVLGLGKIPASIGSSSCIIKADFSSCQDRRMC
jgi:hypothetical protein